MSLVMLYLVPALIGLLAAFLARKQKRLVLRIGLAGLLAVPAVAGWNGIVLAAQGDPAVGPSFWATILSAPGWALGVVLGALVLRRPT